MPSDPFKVFREGSAQQRENIKMIWPDLYQALALPAGSKPNVTCAVCSGGPEHKRMPAVGRLTLNGTPACRDCINAISQRAGGYPLELIDPREWKP